jgi:hypothetical protein
MLLSIQIKRSISILTARVDKVSVPILRIYTGYDKITHKIHKTHSINF